MFQSFLYKSNSSTEKNKPEHIYSSEDRRKRRQKLLEKCGNDTDKYICVAIDKGQKSGDIKNWKKSTFYYAVEKQSTLAQLMVKMSEYLQLQSRTGLFYYCQDKMLRPDLQLSQLEPYVSKDDGFVHITAQLQSAYG